MCEHLFVCGNNPHYYCVLDIDIFLTKLQIYSKHEHYFA